MTFRKFQRNHVLYIFASIPIKSTSCWLGQRPWAQASNGRRWQFEGPILMSSLLEIGEVLLEHCHITARSFSIKVGIKVCGGWNGLLFAPTIFLEGETCAKAKGSEKHRKFLEVTIQLLLNSKKLWTWGTIIPIQDIPPLIQSSDFCRKLLDGMKTPGRWTNDGSPHHGEISNECQNTWFVLYHPCTLDLAKSSFFCR